MTTSAGVTLTIAISSIAFQLVCISFVIESSSLGPLSLDGNDINSRDFHFANENYMWIKLLHRLSDLNLFRCSFSFPCFPDLPHSNENHRDEHHPGSHKLQDAHGELKEGSLEREGIVKAVVDFELFETWRRKETMMLVALSTRLITCASSYLRERVWVVWNF